MCRLDLTLCVVTFLTFGLNLFINSYIGSGGQRFGLNFSSIGDVSGEFETDITPAGWAFAIWGLIYLWQILLQIYLALTILCSGDNGSSVTRSLTLARRWFGDPSPCYLPAFYTAYTVNLLATIAWVFVWCLGYANYAMPCIALTPICLWLALGIALKGFSQEQPIPHPSYSPTSKAALTILFVHNGVGLYATWTTIATLINVVVILVYYTGVTMATSCAIALGFLSAGVLAWFAVDMALKSTTRYLMTPYCVLIFALGASLAKNWDGGSPTAVFTATLLGVSALMLMVKLVLIAVALCRPGRGTAAGFSVRKQASEKVKLVF